MHNVIKYEVLGEQSRIEEETGVFYCKYACMYSTCSIYEWMYLYFFPHALLTQCDVWRIERERAQAEGGHGF